MSKTRKFFWRVFILLLILVAVAAIVVMINLGRIIKSGVEVYGPKITKVAVTVDTVDIGLLTASAEVKNLVVGNPSGYKTPQAISVGDISVGVNPSTVLSDKIVVRSINIQYPEITFEGSLGGNNLSTILANVDNKGAAIGTVKMGTNTVSQATPASQPAPSRKLEVDDLVITGAKVNGSLSLFGREVTLNNIPIPDIHLSNLGTGPDGITPAALTSQILHSITTATLTAVTTQATKLGGTATDLGTKGASGVKKALGNLFGK
ncbi:MAG TPA: hypothetical protein VGI03_02460 [Verrucomicrobiae bacterium]|jgi:uncharacterized protein involved in outer membrane biogenesis